MSCILCNKLLSPGKVPVHIPINVPFNDIDQNVDKSSIQAKEEFITAISRGGLAKPSDYIYICSVHSSALCSFIFSQEDLKKSLFVRKSQGILLFTVLCILLKVLKILCS